MSLVWESWLEEEKNRREKKSWFKLQPQFWLQFWFGSVWFGLRCSCARLWCAPVHLQQKCHLSLCRVWASLRSIRSSLARIFFYTHTHSNVCVCSLIILFWAIIITNMALFSSPKVLVVVLVVPLQKYFLHYYFFSFLFQFFFSSMSLLYFSIWSISSSSFGIFSLQKSQPLSSNFPSIQLWFFSTIQT